MSGLPCKPIQCKKITDANFKKYGQFVRQREDGEPFGAKDAQLNLSAGQPRFYIMRLPKRGLVFKDIARHKLVTQCLGAVTPNSWYMAVATNDVEVPNETNLEAFKIPHGTFVMLKEGTWHAGPLFQDEEMSFFNLELDYTNENDGNVLDLPTATGSTFEIIEPDNSD